MNSAPKGTVEFTLNDRRARLKEWRGHIRSGRRVLNPSTQAIIEALEAEIAELEAALNG